MRDVHHRFALADQQFADWPPSLTLELHGWTLRSAPGVYRARSTSARPPHEGAMTHLDEVLERATAWAQEHAQPLSVQVNDWQDDLDADLAARGWTVERDSLVMAVPTPVLAGASPAVVTGLDDTWLQVHREVEARIDVDATVAEVYTRLGDRARFLQVPGLAVALAVDSPGYVGIYSVATRPEARGQGLATQLLRAAAAGAHGREAYLQVTATNPAVRLYEGLGFRTVGGYRYRVAPAGGLSSGA